MPMPLSEPPPRGGSGRRWCCRGCIGCGRRWSSRSASSSGRLTACCDTSRTKVSVRTRQPLMCDEIDPKRGGMKLPRTPSAVVFDMDGLLFDTEALRQEALLLAAAEGGHEIVL